MKQVVIDFLPDGTVQIDAQNFQGVECEAATKAFQEALGEVQVDRKKPEYHQEARAAHRQRLQGR
jgi:hypothetical protein